MGLQWTAWLTAEVRDVRALQGIRMLRIQETKPSRQKIPESFPHPAFSMSPGNSFTFPSGAEALSPHSQCWGAVGPGEPSSVGAALHEHPGHRADGGDAPVPAQPRLRHLGSPGGSRGKFLAVPACPDCLELCRCSQRRCGPTGPAGLSLLPRAPAQLDTAAALSAVKLVLMRRQGEPSSALSD